MRKNLKYNKGFTLAELLVVVAILTVIIAIAIPAFTASLDKSKRTVCAYNRQQLVRQYYTYVLLGTQLAPPTDTESLCPAGGVYTINNPDNQSYTITCSVHGDSSGSSGSKPDDSMSSLHILDPITGGYVTLVVHGTGVGAKSSELLRKIIYYPGSDKYEAGYYCINAAQYSSNIKDMDAYLEIITGWSARNFVKVNADAPIQVYDPAVEVKGSSKTNNSSIVNGQFYYIDFQWDDVDGPVLAMYIGSTNDTFWRGDLTDDTKWPTNKGLWMIAE